MHSVSPLHAAARHGHLEVAVSTRRDDGDLLRVWEIRKSHGRWKIIDGY